MESRTSHGSYTTCILHPSRFAMKSLSQSINWNDSISNRSAFPGWRATIGSLMRTGSVYGNYTLQDVPQLRGIPGAKPRLKLLLGFAPFRRGSFQPRFAFGGQSQAACATVFPRSNR